MGAAGVAMISAITLYDTSIAPGFLGSTLFFQATTTCSARNDATPGATISAGRPSLRSASPGSTRSVRHLLHRFSELHYRDPPSPRRRHPRTRLPEAFHA